MFSKAKKCLLNNINKSQLPDPEAGRPLADCRPGGAAGSPCGHSPAHSAAAVPLYSSQTRPCRDIYVSVSELLSPADLAAAALLFSNMPLQRLLCVR